MSAKRILFVCTGNSCRSVMAQGFMQHLAQRAGQPDLEVVSAGVFAVEGMTPTRETQRLLGEIGVDCSGHRARPLTITLVNEAELIFVMEQFQLEEILQRFPEARGKVHLLKAYGLDQAPAPHQANIPDPIGKPMEVYEVCFSDIREAVERVAKTLGLRPA